MASHQSKAQKATVERVMHEFKEGELRIRGSGPKVKSRKQAIATALSEAGASNQQSAEENRQRLKETKAKERRGETAEAEIEGKAAQDRTLAKGRGELDGGSKDEKTKSVLYAEARKREIPGRSSMTKRELAQALER
jgi:hypothetical protein